MDGDETIGGAPAAGTGLAPEPVPPASDPASAMTGASLIQGGAWNLLSLLVPQLFSLIISVIAARYLVPELFGVAAGLAGAGSLAFWVAFASLAVGLHIVSADDAAWLDDQLGHRLGGRLGRGLRLAARPAPLS